MTHSFTDADNEAQYNRFIKDFETIVNIDSSSDLVSGIEAVGRFFQKRLEAIGFTTTLHFLSDAGIPCLEAMNHPGDSPNDIMFLGHMDTVFPPGEVAARPFSIEGNRAFGPGVADMKGGLLVALHALERLHEAGELDRIRVCVAFNGDEETGSESSISWLQGHAARSRQVFVFEPCRPGYRFVLRRKGGGWFTVTARGTSAHAGADPEKGANAVVEIAHQIMAINGLNRPEIGTSANVTVIQGGDKINIIPALASASVDIRIQQPDEKERIETFFRAVPDKVTVSGVTLSVEGHVKRPPMEPNEKTMALWDTVQASARAAGIQAEYISTGGCSDGNYTSAAGAPTIDGMGIVGTNTHRPDEYAELDSVIPMIRIIAGACRILAGL